MTADPKTNKVPDEDLTSSQGPHAPRRDKKPERQYPEFERKEGVNRTDDAAPGGPVNIPVRQAAPERERPEGATPHPPVGKQGSSSLPEE